MGRVEFTKSITYHKPFEDMILEYFNELMILYDFVYEYKDIDISTNDNNDRMAFTIVFDTDKIAKNSMYILDKRVINKFDKTFESNAQHIKNEIYVEIISRG